MNMNAKIKVRSLPVMILSVGFLMGSCGENKKAEDQQNESLTDTTSQMAATENRVNELTQEERDNGWQLLFDGQSTDGWRGYLKDEFPSQGWTIEDGAIKVIGSGAGEAGGGGDIIYDEEFESFEFALEWKVSEGGNSGIFYLAEEIEGEPIFTSAPEMQILDNERHPDARLGRDGNRMAGSLYDLIPAKPQNSKPAGEWNSVRITVQDGKVKHFQNGEQVVEYELWTDQWKEMVADSKFKDWQNFINAGGDDKKGYIGLQDHGDDVWFRNIKIRKL